MLENQDVQSGVAQTVGPIAQATKTKTGSLSLEYHYVFICQKPFISNLKQTCHFPFQ